MLLHCAVIAWRVRLARSKTTCSCPGNSSGKSPGYRILTPKGLSISMPSSMAATSERTGASNSNNSSRSWVFGNSICRLTRNAFRYFSAACWHLRVPICKGGLSCRQAGSFGSGQIQSVSDEFHED